MILKKIVEKKRMRLEKENYILNGCDIGYTSESFENRLKEDKVSIIGEIKRASPSKGIIKSNLIMEDIVDEYNKCVEAISVLTEEDFFKGSKKDLINIRKFTNLPILRKDFIINSMQIRESKAIGADIILLIAAILTENQLKKFYDLASKLSLDVIIEIHTKEELKKALKVNPKIIGINNRNLKTFHIDLKKTNHLKKMIPKDILVISESGIHERKDFEFIKPVNGVLIGESFMKSNKITEKVNSLRGDENIS